MSDKAILDGKDVIPVNNVVEWARWFEFANRHVAENKFGDIRVSTVFLGMDHGFGGRPLWFETLVFGGEHDGHMERYTTWDEAVVGHQRIVRMVGGLH